MKLASQPLRRRLLLAITLTMSSASALLLGPGDIVAVWPVHQTKNHGRPRKIFDTETITSAKAGSCLSRSHTTAKSAYACSLLLDEAAFINLKRVSDIGWSSIFQKASRLCTI